MGGNYYGDEDLEALRNLALSDPDPAIRSIAVAAMAESEKARKAEEASSYQPTRSERFGEFMTQKLNEACAVEDEAE